MYSKSKIRMHMLLMALVIIGSINWGTHAFGYNIVDILSKEINKLFNLSVPINKIIYLCVAVAGLFLAFNRSTWLPFLGNTVFPESLIPLSELKTSDTSIEIKTLPNVKIAYWAALNKGQNTNVKLAYGNYENSGVVMSNLDGVAKLPIITGSGYTLPSGTQLPRHIHYRIIGNSDNYSMMGEIETINY